MSDFKFVIFLSFSLYCVHLHLLILAWNSSASHLPSLLQWSKRNTVLCQNLCKMEGGVGYTDAFLLNIMDCTTPTSSCTASFRLHVSIAYLPPSPQSVVCSPPYPLPFPEVVDVSVLNRIYSKLSSLAFLFQYIHSAGIIHRVSVCVFLLSAESWIKKFKKTEDFYFFS